MPENTVIYLRKSRSDPDAESIDDTLSRHYAALSELAARQRLLITEIYKEVVSGGSLFMRPEMCRLLSDAESEKFSAVLCMDIDRLGRSSQRESGIILETFKEHSIKIITPQKTYDLNDDIDEMSTEMQTFLARQELKSITKRLQRGMRSSAANGCHIGEPPYGYRREYIGKKPTLKIDEREAEVIRLVFDMYVNQHKGSHAIAETLNAMGYKPRNADKFGRNTISFYLGNETYTGKIVWNKARHKRPKAPGGKNRTIPNPKEEWIISDGLHPAIISREIFDEAQRIRQTRAHPPAFTGELKNPFAGLLYCKNCGKPLQRHCSPKCGPRLLCETKGCNRSINLAIIEDCVLKAVKRELHKTVTHTDSAPDNRAELLASSLSEVRKELKALSAQKSRLYDFLEQGIYDTDTFLSRSRILSEKAANAESVYEDLNKQLLSLPAAIGSQASAIPAAELLNGYYALSAAEKNIFFKYIINKMYYLKTDRGGGFELTIDFK